MGEPVAARKKGASKKAGRKKAAAKPVAAPAESLSVAEFKANAPRVMERVRAFGKPVLVTRHGKPLVRVIPAEAQESSPYGWMQGTVTHVGDVVSSDPTEWADEPDGTDGHPSP